MNISIYTLTYIYIYIYRNVLWGNCMVPNYYELLEAQELSDRSSIMPNESVLICTNQAS